MSGPTREEVGVAETAALQNGRNARKMLEAVEPLLRARHVREAVEGLSDEWIQEYGDVQPFESDCVVLKPEERVRRLADGIAGFRIALLDALTGEGK